MPMDMASCHLVAWKPVTSAGPTGGELRSQDGEVLVSNYIVVLGVLSPLIQLIRPPFRGCKSLLEFVPADMKDMK